jgi:hypothetical protein
MMSQPSWPESQAQQAVSFSQQQEYASFSQQEQQQHQEFFSSPQQQQQQYAGFSQQQQQRHTGFSQQQQTMSLTQPATSSHAPLAHGAASPATFGMVGGQVPQLLQRSVDGHHAALQLSASQPMLTPPRPSAYHVPHQVCASRQFPTTGSSVLFLLYAWWCSRLTFIASPRSSCSRWFLE